MNVQEERVGKFLKNFNQYYIPHYQRSYEWGYSNDQEVDGFLKDLFEITDAENEQKYHFMGTLIFQDIGNISKPDFDTNIIQKAVVDGQQRITTLLLTLIALKNLLK